MSFFSPYFSHICLHVLPIKIKYCQIWSDLGFFSAAISAVHTNNKPVIINGCQLTGREHFTV